MSRTQPGLEIRQAAYADREAITEFFSGLSPRSRYLRFFTTAPSLSAKMLRILAGGGDNIDVVVAAERGTVIGHAMAVDAIGPGGIRSADIGVVVADDWQGRGVGSRLMLAVAGRAHSRGVRTLVMDVLAENRPVLAMIARRWPEARREMSRASVTVRARFGAVDHADGPWEGEPAPAGGPWTPRPNGHAGLPVPEHAEGGLPYASPGKIPVGSVGYRSGRVLLSTSDR